MPRTKVRQKKNILKSAPPEQVFFVHDGPVLSTLEDLSRALLDMSEEQFAYHTKRNGNDFARWVRKRETMMEALEYFT